MDLCYKSECDLERRWPETLYPVASNLERGRKARMEFLVQPRVDGLIHALLFPRNMDERRGRCGYERQMPFPVSSSFPSCSVGMDRRMAEVDVGMQVRG